MILEKLRDLVAEQMNIKRESVTPESDIIKDIGADSLDIVEMLMNVESEWGIVIDDEDIESIKTVGDVIKCIESKIK